MTTFLLRACGWILLALASAFGAIMIIAAVGIAIETLGRHSMEIERCQKQAVTPWEYRQC